MFIFVVINSRVNKVDLDCFCPLIFQAPLPSQPPFNLTYTYLTIIFNLPDLRNGVGCAVTGELHNTRTVTRLSQRWDGWALLRQYYGGIIGILKINVYYKVREIESFVQEGAISEVYNIRDIYLLYPKETTLKFLPDFPLGSRTRVVDSLYEPPSLPLSYSSSLAVEVGGGRWSRWSSFFVGIFFFIIIILQKRLAWALFVLWLSTLVCCQPKSWFGLFFVSQFFWFSPQPQTLVLFAEGLAASPAIQFDSSSGDPAPGAGGGV